MRLWQEWWKWVAPLRGACARRRTFIWMGVALIGFCVRPDLWGVTSLVRALGLKAVCYDRLLDFFHSPALEVETLTRLWTARVVRRHPGCVVCNGRLVILGDGVKVAKAGKKMPGVKRIHQQSESNTKPEYILGHSCQALAILVRGLSSVVALPLTARIHEGVVFSNRDQRTLLDKMIALIASLNLDEPCYFVADAYYASCKIVRPLLRMNHHLVTRVRKNAVAYRPAPPKQRPTRGRPKVYGDKVPLKTLFDDPAAMQAVESPVYGESGVTLAVRVVNLLWRPVGMKVRFVAVIHPTRGRLILMTTDLAMAPCDVIRLYGYRFKIEVSFKSALHTVGAFLYHFWMAEMTPIGRKAKKQHLHRKSAEYRAAVSRKLDAYHRFIQLGLIAQGVMVALATTVPALVWSAYGSWMRTVRPGVVPSEAVVADALKNTLHYFLAEDSPEPILAKFIQEKLDWEQTQAKRLSA